MPDGLEAFVAGRIETPWSHRSRDLDGAPVVKISLKTSDFATARERWAVVHPQVEALVRKATERALKAEAARGAPLMVDTLDAAAIATMAEQLRHDVLAADDASWDPDHVSPLGSVVRKVVSKTAFGSDGTLTEEVAGKVRARLAKGRLKRKDHFSPDRSMVEGSIDVPPHIREEILQAGANARKGDRLSPEATALRPARSPARPPYRARWRRY